MRTRQSLWFALVLALAGTYIGTAAAETRAEQSVNPARSDWKHMTPSSFPVSVLSVRDQCVRSADHTLVDRLELRHCVVLEAKLSAGECVERQVEDGIIHDLMNGRRDGKSRVTEGERKLLGRLDRALVCDLGDSIDAYWYTGEPGKSCNNVAFTFRATPITVAVPVEPEPKYIEVRVCDTVPTVNFGPPAYQWSTSSLLLPHCSGQSFFLAGQTTRYESLVGYGAIETNCRVIKQEVQ